MLLLLIALFILIPIAELYVIVQVAQSIGVLETLGLLVLVSIVGGWLARREGIGVLMRIQVQLHNGRMPTNELVDGAILLFAGALMLTPGFITDIVGLLLVFPPTRVLSRKLLVRRYRRRISLGAAAWGRGGRWRGVVVDVEAEDEPPFRPPPRREIE